MSRAEKAGELVLKAIDCTKRDDLRQAVKYLDEAIQCIEYAMNYENYGSTGQHIMKQKLKQYTKYVAKLRAKLPPEDKEQDEPDVHTQVPQTTAEVHKAAEDPLVTTAVEEPSHTVTYPELVTTAVQEPHQTVSYPQLVPASLDEPDCGQHVANADRLQAAPHTGHQYTNTDRLQPDSGQQVTSGDRLQQHNADTLQTTQDNTAHPSQEDHHTELVTRIMSPTLRPTHQPPASATPGDVLFKMPPGEADYKNLGTAITFAKKGTQADTENSLAEALDLYNKAIDFFHLSMNGELNTELGRQHVRPQVDYCENRAEVISRVLQSDRSGYLSTDDDGVDRDSSSDVGDQVGDAATLQRRRVEQHDEIVGLDVVRSVLLDAATSSSGSFRSILLVGATGTGKTSVVDNLFRNTSRSYIYKDAAIFSQLDACIDTSLEDMFEGARQVKPCVIFLDRIDELFPRGRQQNNTSHVRHPHRQLSDQLTEQLTDVDDRNKEMIFISATDCPWFISPEVRDRFDTVIYTPLPGPAERLSIAKLNTANMLHALSEEDFVTIAERTHGFTGADIDGVIRNAMVSTIKELQNATHFKEVKFPEDNNTQAWTPCSPEEPGARQMLWSDVVQVHPPEITMRHVLESLEDRGSSVPASEVYRLRDWVLQTGKAPPEQADLVHNRPEEPMELPPGPEEATATLAANVPHPAYRPSAQTHYTNPATEQPPTHCPPYQPHTQSHQNSPPVETSKLQGSSPMDRLSEVGLVSGLTAALVPPPSHGALTAESSYMSNTSEMSTQTEVMDESASFSYHLDYPSMGSMGSMGAPVSVDAFCQTDYEDEQPHGLLIIPEPPPTLISPEATVYETSSLEVTAANTMSTETIPEPSKAVIPSGAIVYETSSPKMAPKSMSTETTEHPSALLSSRPTVYQTAGTPAVTQNTQSTPTVTPHTASTAPQSSCPGVFLRTVSEHKVVKSEPQPAPDNVRHTEQEPCMERVVPDKVRQEQPPVDMTLYSLYRQPLSISSEQSHNDTHTAEPFHQDTPEPDSEPIHTDTDTPPVAIPAPVNKHPHPRENDDDGRKSMQTVQESWHEEVIYDNAGKDTEVIAPVITPELPVSSREQSVEEIEESKCKPDEVPAKLEPDKSVPQGITALLVEEKSKPDRTKVEEELKSVPGMEKDKSMIEITPSQTEQKDKYEPAEEVAEPEVVKEKSKSVNEEEASKPDKVTAVVKEDKTKPEQTTPIQQADERNPKPGATTEVPTELSPETERIEFGPSVTSTPIKAVLTEAPASPLVELEDVPEVSSSKDNDDVGSLSVQQTLEEEKGRKEIPTITTTSPTPDTAQPVPVYDTGTEEAVTTTPPTPDTAQPVPVYDTGTVEEPTLPHRDVTEHQTEPHPGGQMQQVQPQAQTPVSPMIESEEKTKIPVSPTVSDGPVSPTVVSEPISPGHVAPYDAVQHGDLDQDEPMIEFYDDDYFITPTLASIKEEEEPPPAESAMTLDPDPTPVNEIVSAGPTDSQPSTESELPSVEPAKPANSSEEDIDNTSDIERVPAAAQVSMAQKELVAALEKVRVSETGPTPEEAPVSNKAPISEDAPTLVNVLTSGKVPVIEETQTSVPTLQKAPTPEEYEETEDIPASEKALISKETRTSDKVPASENAPEPENVPKQDPEADKADVAPTPAPVQWPPGMVPTALTLAMEEDFMKEQLRKMAEAEEDEPSEIVDKTKGDVKDEDSALKDLVSPQAPASKDDVSVSQESVKPDNQSLSSEDQMKVDVDSTWL